MDKRSIIHHWSAPYAGTALFHLLFFKSHWAEKIKWLTEQSWFKKLFKRKEKVMCQRCADRLKNQSSGRVGVGYSPDADMRKAPEVPVGMLRNLHEAPMEKKEEVREESLELMELIETANKGRDALSKLVRKYRERVEWFGGVMDGPKPLLAVSDTRVRLRIKDKPRFEEFTVAKGWLVKIDYKMGEERLFVGCRSTGTKRAYEILDDMLNHNKSAAILYKSMDRMHPNTSSNTVRATKNGLVMADYDTVSWAEAQKIFEALDRYLYPEKMRKEKADAEDLSD